MRKRTLPDEIAVIPNIFNRDSTVPFTKTRDWFRCPSIDGSDSSNIRLRLVTVGQQLRIMSPMSISSITASPPVKTPEAREPKAPDLKNNNEATNSRAPQPTCVEHNLAQPNLPTSRLPGSRSGILAS